MGIDSVLLHRPVDDHRVDDWLGEAQHIVSMYLYGIDTVDVSHGVGLAALHADVHTRSSAPFSSTTLPRTI